MESVVTESTGITVLLYTFHALSARTSRGLALENSNDD